MSAKRYKLFKADDDGRPAPCAFFASPEGCKNGTNCKFVHEHQSAPRQEIVVAAPQRERSASLVSSESEGGCNPLRVSIAPAKGEIQQSLAVRVKREESVRKPEEKKKRNSACVFFTSTNGCKSGDKCRFLHEQPTILISDGETVAIPSTASDPNANGTQEPIGKPKRNRRSGDGDIFAAPKGTAQSKSPRPTKKAKPSEDDPSFRAQKGPVVSQSKIPASKSAKVEPPKGNAAPSFRQLNLPIASFSIPGFQVKDSQDMGDSSNKTVANLPLPKSTAAGRRWLTAVIKTRENSRYTAAYDFQKLREQDTTNGCAMPSDWIKAKPFGNWCKNNPQTIAIDCEMCETQDPVTGLKNHRALCRLSIVNGDNPEEVLLDTLVKPPWPVTDYRTWVNGIEKKHLENVEFTIQHAQAFLLALCSEETVILGHAVYNDLAAIRMEHQCVVDSSYLFSVKDEPDANPGLKDITKALLSMDMPKTHDSVNDALMAFRCLEVWLEKRGDVEPVERTKSTKNKLAPSQLFIHRVPKICQKNHLEIMFLNHTSIQPTGIQDVEFNGDNGKTVLTFASPKHANLAFASLEGEEDSDASGRLQKKVFLRNGGYIRVRKMVHERVNKRLALDEKPSLPCP
ncbi:exonuclease [Fragilaria crotonensis]|nr:exonuclease [Fragilaria crotonensis]